MRGFYYEVAHNCNPFRVTKALFKRSFRKFPEQLLKLGYIKNKIAPKCNFYLLMKRMFCLMLYIRIIKSENKNSKKDQMCLLSQSNII